MSATTKLVKSGRISTSDYNPEWSVRRILLGLEHNRAAKLVVVLRYYNIYGFEPEKVEFIIDRLLHGKKPEPISGQSGLFWMFITILETIEQVIKTGEICG